MRLRFLHLPRCGPLTDTAVVFGREDLIAQALNLPRKGSLNFVVGVNGSGKSSLLRAIYHVFRSLSQRQLPTLPLTLAWDRTQGSESLTTILHITNEKDSIPFCATLAQVPNSALRSDWQGIMEAVINGRLHPLVNDLTMVQGNDAFTSPLLYARLPKRLIAYSSGAIEPWTQLERPDFNPKDEEIDNYLVDDERPPGWNINHEWELEQESRISKELNSYTLKTKGTSQNTSSGVEQYAELNDETFERFWQDLSPLQNLRKKISANHVPRSGRLNDTIFSIQTRHLRYAGIILGIWQATQESSSRAKRKVDMQIDESVELLLNSDRNLRGARRVLNGIDWFCPTHLSITYHDTADRLNPRAHQELLCLVALAEEVIALPRGRMRAVFALGHSSNINLTKKLKEAFRSGIQSKMIEFIASRVDGCPTMAEAFLRIFSEDKNLDSTPLDVFTRLREWEHSGLLEDITLTVKRLEQPVASDGEPDDVIVTYDQLSDGEQMLLGRMGLLFLLRGQDGSLLLLDEPETHFNDVWKREIVDMVDLGLLNSTEANVIVATHTSIALTDAFAAEVTLLTKKEGKTMAEALELPIFGADPGRVLLHVFGAPDMIGVRAANLLRKKLAQVKWTHEETEALRSLIDKTGSGWPRAKLMDILDKLDNPDAPPGT